ncbi:alpha/beta-hydrolase [Thozetella sp. PMI_491]|nr:alpha/beta-hydrolase [Thozetella sp. PMI_491]
MAIPTVDLGYEIHTAATGVSDGLYIFSNIPYADQPVGALRFSAPVLPTGKSSHTNNGSTNVICMQAASKQLLEQKAALYGISLEEITALLYGAAAQTEACLALDVYVPESVFNNRSISKVPVLVWIHGGGFTSGSKSASSNPVGLISRSILNGEPGLVYVTINYRLGLFGWLGGRSDIIPNLGLYDQAIALQWVQKYISLFGGDKNQVTVMGESAGASSILHHVTAYGGTPQPSFARAVMQSPSFQFSLNATANYNLVMTKATNMTGSAIFDVTELARLDSVTLKAINEAIVYDESPLAATFGPIPDGSYVPAIPQVLLAQGRFSKDIEIMTGHNSAEAVPFMPANFSTTGDAVALLEPLIPTASNATLEYIVRVLYPSEDYSSELLRGAQIATDSSFSCSTRYLGLAFKNASYNYLFAIPPGYHAEDLPYTFFNGSTSTVNGSVAIDANTAHALQDYLVGFALSADPNKSPAGASETFQRYGSTAQVMAFTTTGLVMTADDMDNVRCTWWQKAFVEGLVTMPLPNINTSTTRRNSTPSGVSSSLGSRGSPEVSQRTIFFLAILLWPLVVFVIA